MTWSSVLAKIPEVQSKVRVTSARERSAPQRAVPDMNNSAGLALCRGYRRRTQFGCGQHEQAYCPPPPIGTGCHGGHSTGPAAGPRETRRGRPPASEHQRASASARLARVCTHRHALARCACACVPEPPDEAGAHTLGASAPALPAVVALTWHNATGRSTRSELACVLHFIPGSDHPARIVT
jgi:hypothetical protein